MIKCKIISVNAYDPDVLKSVKDFGQHINNDGKKLRYLHRRENIEKFITQNSLDNYVFEIFNAITPKDFHLRDNIIFHGKDKLLSETKSKLYMANNLSHYEIWKLDEDTLVLEDDIILNNEKFKGIQESIYQFKDLRIKNKILYLQRSTPWKKDGDDRHYEGIKTYNPNFIIPFNNSDFSGTAAYFITKETKSIIINNMRPLNPCDKYLDNLRKEQLLTYIMPSDKNIMLNLNKETMWL